MSTVRLKVGGLDDALEAFKDVWETGNTTDPVINFVSWDLMHRVLSPKRLEIIRTLCGQPPMSIREISRRVARDFKGVHTDVAALVASGLVEQRDGKICFPYDRIHVEFDIEALWRRRRRNDQRAVRVLGKGPAASACRGQKRRGARRRFQELPARRRQLNSGISVSHLPSPSVARKPRLSRFTIGQAKWLNRH